MHCHKKRGWHRRSESLAIEPGLADAHDTAHFGSSFWTSLRSSRWAGVVRIAPTLAPDVIVASGDFTQRAKAEQFEQARDFLNGLPPVPRVVVPGNHDVPLYPHRRADFGPPRPYRQYMSARARHHAPIAQRRRHRGPGLDCAALRDHQRAAACRAARLLQPGVSAYAPQARRGSWWPITILPPRPTICTIKPCPRRAGPSLDLWSLAWI